LRCKNFDFADYRVIFSCIDGFGLSTYPFLVLLVSQYLKDRFLDFPSQAPTSVVCYSWKAGAKVEDFSIRSNYFQQIKSRNIGQKHQDIESMSINKQKKINESGRLAHANVWLALEGVKKPVVFFYVLLPTGRKWEECEKNVPFFYVSLAVARECIAFGD
ncbi:MAG: hypothetical protein PHQ26_09190, partial [Bacteroidales bacterium]|nr:hypothetical protein [Bacteroidales bacterium]MDD4771635.1 hypothetical protein [Bacteroidales bacterium]